jgi:hypothetical protein
MRRLLVVASLALAAIGLTACGSSSSASRGKIVCPSSDKFSCYYSGSNSPVHGPRTLDGYRVVGHLPKYCTVTPSRCNPTGAVTFYDGAPPGEYLQWQIRSSGADRIVVVYITKSEENKLNTVVPR